MRDLRIRRKLPNHHGLARAKHSVETREEGAVARRSAREPSAEAARQAGRVQILRLVAEDMIRHYPNPPFRNKRARVASCSAGPALVEHCASDIAKKPDQNLPGRRFTFRENFAETRGFPRLCSCSGGGLSQGQLAKRCPGRREWRKMSSAVQRMWSTPGLTRVATLKGFCNSPTSQLNHASQATTPASSIALVTSISTPAFIRLPL